MIEYGHKLCYAAVMKKTTDRQLGHGLRIARHRAMMRADASASELGFTGDTIRRYERGGSKVPALVLLELAALYGTTIEQILADGAAA